MFRERFDSAHGKRIVKQGFRLFRYFQFISLAAIVVILIVAVLGLRFIFRSLVLYEAEKDAIRISNSLRDSEMRQFVQLYLDNKQYLSISQEQLPEMDRHMRVCLVPFDIVKIKVFNAETRVIYSTDSKIIGRLDPDNAKLATALSGSPISKYESKDNVWDLDDEERKDVEIVETYVPIYNWDGEVIGSFEIYKDVTRDLAMADRTLIRAGAVLLVTVLGVFGILMFVIHCAVRAINSGTAELAAANTQLLQEMEERKRLEKELLGIIERERQRIGQELHDSIGQQLAGIKFMTEVLEEKLSGKSLPEASYAAKITTHVRQATDQARNLAKGLHPVDLDASGLTSALGELSETTKNLFGVSCTFKCDESVLIDDTVVAINLYRIAQEAVTNAIRHGKAKNVLVELSSSGDRSTLTVENDGLDFPELQAECKGMGLKIMDYRAEMIGGSLNIRKGDNGGTIVTCVFQNKRTNNNAEENHGS